MRYAKVAISIEEETLRRLDRLVAARRFGSRSEAFATAVKEKLDRMDRKRLAAECAKLNRREEQALADLGLSEDARSWPEY